MTARRLLVLAVGPWVGCAGAPDPTPDPSPPDSAWVQISGEYDYLCARRQSGEVRCWGQPWVDTEGHGSNPLTSPELPDLPPGRYGHVSVSSFAAVCGLTLESSELGCGFATEEWIGWGFWSGHDPLTADDLPPYPARDMQTFQAGLLLWLDASGRPRCVGELCPEIEPLPIEGGFERVILEPRGPWFVVALRGDGTAVSWGERPLPIDAPDEGYRDVEILAGDPSAFALTLDGDVKLLGTNRPAWGSGWNHCPPQDWSGVVAIAGAIHSLVALWPDGHMEECEPSTGTTTPIDPDVYFHQPELGLALPPETQLRSIHSFDGLLCAITESWGVWCNSPDPQSSGVTYLPWAVPDDLLPAEVLRDSP